MKRPRKITPDPIIDAVVELRYETDVPPDAVLGMLFAQVQSKYANFVKLPITAIPENIRANDPNFQFAPYYQANFQSFKLNVGPQVISLSNTGQYVGWKDNYFPEIQDLLQKIETANIVKNFIRLGVRYIDFFDLDIFNKINLSVEINNAPLNALQTTFSSVFQTNKFLTKVQVANNVSTNVQGNKKIGSVIDTDTYFEPKEKFGFNGLGRIIDNAHEESVDFFFNLLKILSYIFLFIYKVFINLSSILV